MKREAFRVLSGAALAICLIAVPPATAAKAATLPTAYAPQLTRYPYLTDVAGGGATINWATDRSSASAYVTWGAAGVESCTAHSKSASRTQITVGSTPEYQWKARLALAPDTTYCYRAYLGATGSGLNLLGSNPSPQFATELPAGSTTPFKFAVLGDWGSASAAGNPDQANLIGRLASSGARFALSTGDIAYPGGSQTNYGDLYQTGANVSAVFGPAFWTAAGASMPLFPVLGNHGLNATFPLIWPGASAAAGSAGRFQIDNYCCLNGTASAKYPSVWYAFDAGPARFYMLDAAWANSNLGTGSLYQNDFDYHWSPASPEYQWLEHDLATHPAQVKFATFHFPLYSANATETSDAFLHGPNSLEGLLSRYGVDIAFNGHAHIYERNNANGPGGLISYVTGGGGAPLEPVSKCSGLPGIVAYAIGWSNSSATGSACGSASRPVSSSQVFHFLLVSVDGNTVTVTPTDSLGRTFDSQTYVFPSDIPPPDTTPPTPPASLAATAVNSGRVDLSWSQGTDNVGVTGYQIYRDGALLTTTPASATSYSDTSAVGGTTYQYTVRAVDAAGNASNPSPAASVTTPGNGSVAASFVRDATGTVDSGTSLDAPLTSTAGDTLVATIAVQAGATNSVKSVTDSAGNTWNKGPIGFLSGSNTRVEIWFSSAAAPVTRVTVTLSALDAAAADISEFTGIASVLPLEASAGQGNASSTIAPTPSILTSPADVIVGAINYPSSTASTLASPSFTALTDFAALGVHGRAAYLIAPLGGSYSATWSLAGASTSGGAIAAFRTGP